MSCLFATVLFAYIGTMKMHAFKIITWENCFSRRFGRFDFSIGEVKIQVIKQACPDLHACYQAIYLVDFKVPTYLNKNLLSVSMDR